MNDFGVKYVGQEHAQHLMDTLQENYTISHYWEGTSYLGIDLDWDYCNKRVHLSMIIYIDDTLKRFHQPPPKKPQYQPHPQVKPNYGAKAQYTDNPDTSPLLERIDIKFIQEVVGTLLYYARAVNSTMLVALGYIAVQQAAPTEATMTKVKQLLDYASTHPDIIVTYTASNMVLAGNSDASYLSETNARSRAEVHFSCQQTHMIPPTTALC